MSARSRSWMEPDFSLKLDAVGSATLCGEPRRMTSGERWELGLFLTMLIVGCLCLTAILRLSGVPRIFAWQSESDAAKSTGVASSSRQKGRIGPLVPHAARHYQLQSVQPHVLHPNWRTRLKILFRGRRKIVDPAPAAMLAQAKAAAKAIPG